MARVSIVLNSGTVVTAANTPVTPTTIYIGNTNNGASGIINGHIRVLAAFSTLADADLDTLSAVGAPLTIAGVGAPTATVAQTLGALITAATAQVTVAGVIAETLGILGQTATATVSDAAATTQTLGALTQAVTAAVQAAATTAQTLGGLGQTTTATVQAAAVVAQTLGALGQSLAATVADAAAVAQTLGALGQTATAAATDTATTSQTLGALNQTATAIHQAASAVVAQTLGALGQTATAAATDTAAIAQSLGALQQAVTAAVATAATTAQTLGSLQQLASAQVTDTATFTQNLGALQQTAAGAAQVNAAVTQLLGALGQTATAAVVGQAVVNQVLPGLDQNFFSSQSAHAAAAQTLGDLIQAATGAVDATAAIAQTLGGLTQLTSATVDVLINTIQTLGSLAQAASATAPSSEVDALVAQSLGVLQQAVSGQVPVATAVSQVLTSLGQLASDTALNRATVAQLLQGLQQAITVVAPLPTTILPESVVFVMYEQRILVVPTESRTLMVPGMYGGAGAGAGVIRLPSVHTLSPLQQILTATGADLGPTLPDEILLLEDGGALLWEDGSFFALEENTVSVTSIDEAIQLEDGGFLLTEARDSIGLEGISNVRVLTTAQILPFPTQAATVRHPLRAAVAQALPVSQQATLLVGTAATTLNPSDKSPSVALSGGNLTATSSSGSGMVRATKPGGVDRYFEFIFSTINGGSGSPGVGVATLAQNLAGYMGDPNGAGYYQSGYAEWLGSGTGNSWPTFTTGDVLGVRLRDAGTGGGGSSVATWNPSDKHSNVMLSGGNLTATAAASAASLSVIDTCVRGTTTGSAGKYFELTWTVGPVEGFGLATTSAPLDHYPGDPTGIGFFHDGYVEWPGSGFSNNMGITFGVGDVMGLLLGTTNVQLSKNGTLVYTVSVLPSGALCPILALRSAGESAVANFGASAFVNLPSGAVGWNT